MILLIEDESRWVKRFALMIERAGEESIIAVATRQELIEILSSDEEKEHSLLCFDQDLGPEGRGSEMIQSIRDRFGEDRVMIGVTSSTNPEDIERFQSAGADGVASKAALRNGLADALVQLYRGDPLSPEDARLFEIPAGFIEEWLVAGDEPAPK